MLAAACAIAFVCCIGAMLRLISQSRHQLTLPARPETLAYTFNEPGILQESGSMQESTSPYWWLNSGGELIIKNGIGKTMQGEVSTFDPWRLRYAITNSRDTDQGAHPQNLFRLVSKSQWNDVSETVHFYIVADNASRSPYRNQSNGLLLMSRYTGDGQTLYYSGIRVDGTAVIKKKYHGVYYTLAQKKIFAGTYSRDSVASSSNLLPHGVWIGLRATTITQTDGSVQITLYMQQSDGSWKELLQAHDSGGAAVGGTLPITEAQYAGIRTDFMDVRFADIELHALENR